jgi:hypothetical protein
MHGLMLKVHLFIQMKKSCFTLGIVYEIANRIQSVEFAALKIDLLLEQTVMPKQEKRCAKMTK